MVFLLEKARYEIQGYQTSGAHPVYS